MSIGGPSCKEDRHEKENIKKSNTTVELRRIERGTSRMSIEVSTI